MTHSPSSKKAVVIGASSGIGRALCKVLASHGYELGLTARRMELLKSLQREIPSKTYIRVIDLNHIPLTVQSIEELIREMGGMDLLVVNAGINHSDTDLEWAGEFETVQVNVVGFMAMAGLAIRYFLRQKTGHLVGISSIAGLRGSGLKPAYSASKAFAVNYLEGLRQVAGGANIAVTDIRPGYVDTAILEDKARVFWMASCEKAAAQIYDAIRKKKRVAYITRRWELLGILFRWLPGPLYDWAMAKIISHDDQSRRRETK